MPVTTDPNTGLEIQFVTELPNIEGGLLYAGLVSAASINATVVKASKGQVYTITAYNLNAAVRYLKLYNKATTPAPATDAALLQGRIALPPAQQVYIEFESGLQFTAGIGFALVTGITDTDATAVAVSEQLVNIGYK